MRRSTEIERYVDKWARRLGIDHWEKRVDVARRDVRKKFDTDDDQFCVILCDPVSMIWEVTCFPLLWKAYPVAEDRERKILHELVHALISPIADLIEKARHDPASVSNEYAHHMEENTVENIARVMWNLVGEGEE